VASTNANVLILENPAPKELVGAAIHERSQRRDRPVVKVNCASIPKELVRERILRPRQKARSRSLRDRIGPITTGDGGTIFLDDFFSWRKETH